MKTLSEFYKFCLTAYGILVAVVALYWFIVYQKTGEIPSGGFTKNVIPISRWFDYLFLLLLVPFGASFYWSDYTKLRIPAGSEDAKELDDYDHSTFGLVAAIVMACIIIAWTIKPILPQYHIMSFFILSAVITFFAFTRIGYYVYLMWLSFLLLLVFGGVFSLCLFVPSFFLLKRRVKRHLRYLAEPNVAQLI